MPLKDRTTKSSPFNIIAARLGMGRMTVAADRRVIGSKKGNDNGTEAGAKLIC